MTAKTHTLGGYTAAAATLIVADRLPDVPTMQLPAMALALYLSATTAILPDIDKIQSRAGRKLLFLSAPFWILSILGRLTGNKVFRHRGITHYLITWAILTVSVLVLAYCASTSTSPIATLLAFSLFFIPVGYLSHILLDLISGRIRLFYPLVKKSIGSNLIPCGSYRETLLAVVLLATSILLTTRLF